jgi:hypothetical protein
LRNKYNKLYCHLSHDHPHIICMWEHHLKDFELQLIHLSDYTLGAKYYRKYFQKGGVGIFVYSKLKYNTINLEEFTTENDIEACAIHLSMNYNYYVFGQYPSSSLSFKTPVRRQSPDSETLF